MQRNFGKYNIPPTLQVLIDLRKELENSEQFFESLHFYLTLSNYRYFNTPCDVIVFGHNGADGIHYGFLTDFGAVSDLEEAPIVCICPMNFDEPTRIIANNLRAFLSMNFTDAGLFYNTFASVESYEAYKDKYHTSNMSLQELSVKRYLEERINIPRIENPYHYVDVLQAKRQQLVTIETQDRLGVTTPLSASEVHVPFLIDSDSLLNLEELKAYLNDAPIPSQHAVFRDIQRHYVLADFPELKELVRGAMIKIGLVDEALRLNEII